MSPRLLGYMFAVTIAILSVPAHAQDDPGTLADFAAEWIETNREAAGVPGVIATIIMDGEVVLSGGWGESDLAAHVPANANTRFRVGSISKPVTASAALLAMEEFGRGPEADLRDLFADLPIHPPLDVPLTFQDLLTHTAGFSESFSSQHVTDAGAFDGLDDYLRQHLPPRFEAPGRVITYNDHHTALAGYAVERLSGASFADYARTRLFQPLGMDRSTFDQRDIVENTDVTLARSYGAGGDGAAAYPRDLINTTPAAGLATTAADMGRYLEFLLDADAALLPRDLHMRQLSVQFRSAPQLRGRAYGFAESSRGGHLVLYKDGQANGFGARVLIVPDLGLGIFVAVNRSVLGPMGRRNEAGQFLRDFTGAVLAEAVPPADSGAMPQVLEGVDSAPHAGVYRTTVAARHSWEMLLAMTDTARVAVNDDGSINVGSGRYVPVGESVYQWHEGGPYYVGFAAFEGGGPHYLFIGSGSYERVPWYGVQEGAGAILLAVIGIGTLVLLGGFVQGLRGHLAAWGKFAMASGAARLAFAAALGGTMVLMDPQLLFYGMPLGVRIAVGLAFLALAFDVAALLSFLGSRKRAGTGALVLVYTASAGAFAWWLWYWNLLGWQTG